MTSTDLDATYLESRAATFGALSDYGEIASFGIMSTPALAIDDMVTLAGRVPSVAELVDLIREANP